MTTINKRAKTLFFTTSPRSPMKMVPEIKLLVENFSGEQWNPELQKRYMGLLFEQDFFEGVSYPKDPAFSARDRITRSPKALGFVNLEPQIELTPAGRELVYGAMPSEALLRQLMKFQLPSPYHKLSSGSDQDFLVRPYLEILRLIRNFGCLTRDELMLFGMQLTNYSKFDEIVEKIESFRRGKAMNKGKYKKFLAAETERVIREIYADEIVSGDISVRESSGTSLKSFLRTKKHNLSDYTDACFRYLRATEVVTIAQRGHSLSIAQGKLDEVDHLLITVPREPLFVDDGVKYKEYLFNAETPMLITDEPQVLVEQIQDMDPDATVDGLSKIQLKTVALELRRKNKEKKLTAEISQIKSGDRYQEIQTLFDDIVKSDEDIYDRPLMFEWNTWRAMTMIDGGNISPNFKLDENCDALSTAPGNKADIVCNYEDFDLAVEVTLQAGQKQYDNEGEPVARHLGKIKESSGRDAFCLFIAPKISEASIAHFYALHRVNIRAYGGKAVIVPMELSVYRKMLEDSYKATYTPSSENIRSIFERSIEIAASAEDEIDWYNQIRDFVLNWLAA